MSIVPLIANHVAGPFNAAWLQHSSPHGPDLGASNLSLGVIGDQGIRELRQYAGEETSSSLLGDGVLDATYIGSNLFLEFELEEADLLAVQAISNPFTRAASTTLPNILLNELDYGIPGTFYTDVFGSLILTSAFSANSAGRQSTPTRTYHCCTKAPGFQISKLFHARRRIVAMRLRVYPVDAGVVANGSATGVYVFGTKS